MFDFAWSEILLIGAVALIAIGPKDMPAAIRAVSGMIKKARRMAAEFQTHVDEMVREADLGDVKSALRDIKRMDIPGAFEKAIDPDRSIRNSFADNPLNPVYPTPSEVSTLDEVAVSAPAVPLPLPEPEPAVPEEPLVPLAPAFIPPGLVPKPEVQATAVTEEPPAFIPPSAVLQRQRKP
jgi:sec-independent protein translocase protein TatB